MMAAGTAGGPGDDHQQAIDRLVRAISTRTTQEQRHHGRSVVKDG